MGKQIIRALSIFIVSVMVSILFNIVWLKNLFPEQNLGEISKNFENGVYLQ